MHYGKVGAAVSAAVALAAGAAWLPSGVALAQNAANAASATGGNQLQEVVITAERRATNVQTTPIAVTAVTGAQLQTLHLKTISSLQTTVPSFQSSDQGGFFNSINIRGMGNSAITPIIATGVAVFRDGLLMSETIAEDEPLFDIHDVTVLEGPQGTFVGASSTAGAVEINSNLPSLTPGIHGYIEGQIGDYSDTLLQGAVNLPVSSTFAARIAFNTEERHSFYKNIGSQLTPGPTLPLTDPGHLDSRQARLSMLWKPTSRFQALGQFEYSHIMTGGEPAMPNPYTYNTLFSAGSQSRVTGLQGGCTIGGPLSVSQMICGTPGTVSHSQWYYPGETPFVLDYYNTNQEENELLTHYGLRLDYTFPDGIDLRSQTGFVHIYIKHIDNMSYGPQDAGTLYHTIGPNDNYYSEEVDLISPTTGPFFSKFNWITGAFWNYRDTGVFIQALPTAGTCIGPGPNTGCISPVALTAPIGTNPVVDVFGGSESVERIAAAFGQVAWRFTKTLQLQVGARINTDNNFVFNNPNVAPPPGTVVSTPQGTGTYLINYTPLPDGAEVPTSYMVLSQSNSHGHYSDTVPTGKIDLNWTPLKGQNFYVFYAIGYKAGGTNENSTDHPTFSPEHVNDYEAGWKGSLFGGRMLTQVGGYYVNYQKMQYELFDTVQNNDTTAGNYVANLGTSIIDGIQISAQSKFGPLGLNFGVDYNKTKLGAVTTLPAYALPPGFGSTTAHPQCIPGNTYAAGVTCFDYTPYLANLSGEKLPFAPQLTANISIDYNFAIGQDVLDPRVTFSHTDQQYNSIFQNGYSLMKARNLVSASMDFIAGEWDAQVYGTNLTNETYIVGSGGGGSQVYYGPPRQFGIRVTRNF